MKPTTAITLREIKAITLYEQKQLKAGINNWLYKKYHKRLCRQANSQNRIEQEQKPESEV